MFNNLASSIALFCDRMVRRISNVDWEQRRYEIAKEYYVHALTTANEDESRDAWRNLQEHAESSVDLAERLIGELKRRDRID